MKKLLCTVSLIMVLVLSFTLFCSATWKVVDSFGNPMASSARGASISPDGNYIYVSAIQENKVWKYDIAKKTLVATAEMARIPGINVKAVYADASNTVWVPGSSVPSLFKLDADLTGWTEFKLGGFGIVQPEGVVASGKGEVYVTDRKGKMGIYKFILNGNKLELDKSWGKNGHALEGVLFLQPGIDPDGNVVAGDMGDYSLRNGTTIYRVDNKTGEAKVVSKGDITGPYHVWVGPLGTIYVAQYTNGLSILSADGKLIKSFSTKDLGAATEIAGVTSDLKEEKVFFLDQQLKSGGFIKVLMDK
jgi:streptogramin lyase